MSQPTRPQLMFEPSGPLFISTFVAMDQIRWMIPISRLFTLLRQPWTKVKRKIIRRNCNNYFPHKLNPQLLHYFSNWIPNLFIQFPFCYQNYHHHSLPPIAIDLRSPSILGRFLMVRCSYERKVPASPRPWEPSLSLSSLCSWPHHFLPSLTSDQRSGTIFLTSWPNRGCPASI